MRSWFVCACIVFAACGGGSSAGPGTACPDTLGLSCSQEGLTCEEVLEDGTIATCVCNGATWTCNDCPDGESPVGACAAGASCSVWGFENACACTCDATGEWSCVVDDPSPNFHCAP
ncbi:MAG TPA: hypothetical protein VFQ53_14080 [Kofleriaceae bacterium]|nr:hypothetical protein [Kofleriaceae bacterium]